MSSNCVYQAVPCEIDRTKSESKNDSWKPFWRQLMIACSYWIVCLEAGLCIGAPTIFIPQIRKEANNTDVISAEMVTWLSSTIGYAGLPWIVILSIMMSYLGRRITFAFVCFSMIGDFICYLVSTTPIHILLAEILQGIPYGAAMTVGIAVATEYSAPKYRGLFLTFKSAMFHWGIWISNAIGTFFYWKYFAVFGLICSLCTLNVFVWPRSPLWLASKGRYEECRKAYRWLAGEDEASEKELEGIIATQVKRLKDKRERKRNFKNSLSFLWLEEFYKPVLLCWVLFAMYLLSGKQVCAMYAIDIIKELTDSESTAYTGMLILDGVSVFCMYLGCYVSKYTTRRTMLIGFGIVAGVFLYALSLHCYLIKLGILPENDYIAISLLIGFSVPISAGPFIMIMCLFAELLPINYKSEALATIGILFAIIQSTMFKVSPYIFKYWGLHSAFLFYGTSVFVCVIIIYKYLPETKDKTIVEIANYFRSS